MRLPAFFSSQRPLRRLGVVAGHREGALVAEEVGRVEHEDVQRVALDPLAAVEQPAQRAELPRRPRRRGASSAWHGAHLVGDRADAADPRGDVGHLGTARPRRNASKKRGGSKIRSCTSSTRPPSSGRAARPRPRRGRRYSTSDDRLASAQSTAAAWRFVLGSAAPALNVRNEPDDPSGVGPRSRKPRASDGGVRARHRAEAAVAAAVVARAERRRSRRG